MNDKYAHCEKNPVSSKSTVVSFQVEGRRKGE